MEPEQSTPQYSGWLTRLWLRIAGVDEETLRPCPPCDWGFIVTIAKLSAGNTVYLAAIFCGISHLLFAAPGEIRPDFVLASLCLAGYIRLIDSIMIFRSGWVLSGLMCCPVNSFT